MDDSPASISLYERSTAELDVELITYISPTEGLEYLESHDADLVFLGNFMREIDGLSLLRRMRTLPRHAQTPVIVMTSKDYAQDRTLARQLGALEYLVKPLRSQEIREVILRLIGARPSDGH
ncbi:MAG: response regulator [Gammaproteobacteria bacterium]|nr:response regulator [Gammaproteobacteria bacterium]